MRLNPAHTLLLDLDGVLTPTAEVHMRAWAETFTEVLAQFPQCPEYRDDDYFDHIDGRPRLEGVSTMLASREITLPEGDPHDPPGTMSVWGIGNQKNALFTTVLHRDGIIPYPGSVRLLDHAQGLGMRMAVVSSSRNAPEVLRVSGLADRFSVVVDGAVAAAHDLPGKPAPDTFWWAAEQLGAEPPTSIVVEDAVSGVRAGAAGGFHLVIGVDRGAGASALRSAGADVVVTDLAELL